MARPLMNDLTGQRFGRLTVVERAPNIGNRVAWSCLCDCGNTSLVRSYDLLGGAVRSCGCYHRERVSEVNRFRSL